MGARLGRCAPLAASLLGHAVLLAAAGFGLLAGPTAGPLPDLVPARRAADAAAAGPRLLLETAGEDADAQAGADAVVPLDSADPRYRPYLAVVKRRIWERWSGPDLAPGQPALGSLVVEFTLTRGGRLAASGVVEPSGTPALDRSALDAVARAVPFSPLPESIVGERLRVRARFTYD